jgi:hypothetical protein
LAQCHAGKLGLASRRSGHATNSLDDYFEYVLEVVVLAEVVAELSRGTVVQELKTQLPTTASRAEIMNFFIKYW